MAFIVSAGLLQACTTVKIESVEDMAAWMYQEENGLQKIKEVGDLTLKINYVPPAYFALRENPDSFQQLLKKYDQSISFIISFSGSKGENILWRGLKDYPDYRERIHLLNFELENYIELQSGDKRIHPVLSNVENLYEETDHLRINVVFPKEAMAEFLSEDEFTLQLDDRIFKTGLNVFHFETQKIENIPTPIFAS